MSFVAGDLKQVAQSRVDRCHHVAGQLLCMPCLEAALSASYAAGSRKGEAAGVAAMARATVDELQHFRDFPGWGDDECGSVLRRLADAAYYRAQVMVAEVAYRMTAERILVQPPAAPAEAP